MKDIREQPAQEKHDDDYFSFEQAFFNQINTRNVDEDSKKNCGRINTLNISSEDSDNLKRNTDSTEYEQVEI